MKEEYAERLRGVEEQTRSHRKQIEALSARQDDLEKLTNALAVFATEQKHIKADVEEIKSDVKALAETPARRWELVLEKSLGTLIAALAGFVLARLGLG